MSYQTIVSRYADHNWQSLLNGTSTNAVSKAIAADGATVDQFAALLSSGAEGSLEAMAQRARSLTVQYFGRTMQLYTPLYLANYCDNRCVYCGFNADNAIERKALSLNELEREAAFIASTGLKHILVLTGESRAKSPLSYIKDCIRALRGYFTSIAIEVYALTEGEYKELIAEGVDGLTIYQEVYDKRIYAEMHPAGPKSDYRFRLDAPERGAYAGMHSVNIGVLFGLDDWRKEAFLLGLHAKYLQDNFPDVDIGVSIPRLRPNAAGFVPRHIVTDTNIVQVITALRIFLPRLGISVSTRENARFRESIIPLGITRMSAGSTTCVGGHTAGAGNAQFEISDTRDVASVKSMLEVKGYQPVMKDWMHIE